MKFTAKLLSSLMFLAIAIITINMVTGWSPVIVGIVLTPIILFVPMPQGSLNGVILETWANYIVERFWKDNAFLKNAYDDSDNVVAGRIVHIPQPGSKPLVQKNRTVFPATAVRRTDTGVLYSLDEYTTDPTHIPNIDAIHLSYSKQDSVLGDHMETLTETVADDMLIKWGADATVVSTTGGTGALTVAPVAGQTGTRKAFVHQDLQKLMIRMNAENVPKNDRFVMIDDNMFDAFYSSLSDTTAKDFSRFMDAENGIIGKLHGFSIMTRSSILNITSGGTVKSLGASLAATDHLASFAWQKNSVAFALGTTNLYSDMNQPLYYGDIFSTLVMAGGRVRRGDGKGVYIIAQGA